MTRKITRFPPEQIPLKTVGVRRFAQLAGLLHAAFLMLSRGASRVLKREPRNATRPGPRPKVDRAVLDFVKGHVFDPTDFVIRSDGVCRLSPEMARMVVAKVST